MMEKYLIINADDFGVSRETNKAIAELFLDKRITSTSLIATASYGKEAVELSRKHNFRVGVHLTMNSDYLFDKWKPASSEKNSLADTEGFLNSDLNEFRKKAKSSDVSIECQNQYDLIKKMGAIIDHADNHSGTLYGINGRFFFNNAFRFCKDNNLPFRFPKRNTFLKDFFRGKIPFYAVLAHKFVLSRAKRYGVELIDDMISNPYPIDKIDGYKSLEDYYLDKVRNLKEGVTELFLHPSYDSSPYNNSKEWQKRIYELEFLQSEKLYNLIKDEGIKLCDYTIFRKEVD